MGKSGAVETWETEHEGEIQGEGAGSEAGESRSGSAPSILDNSPISEREIREYFGEEDYLHKTLTMYCANDGHKKVLNARCKGRTCAVCRYGEFKRLGEQYREVLDTVLWPNFVTIAPKNVRVIKQRWVRQILWAIKVVLRRKYWKRKIAGGLLFLECTNIGNGWHPHVHGLFDAEWVEWEKLQGEISEVLGWPVTVNTRRWDKGSNVIKYCLGYLKKTPDIYRVDGFSKTQLKGGKSRKYADFSECGERKRLFDEAFKGVRTVVPFGSLYGVKRPEKKPLCCPDCGGNVWISEHAIGRLQRSEWGEEISEVFQGVRRYRERERAGPVGRKYREEIIREVSA